MITIWVLSDQNHGGTDASVSEAGYIPFGHSQVVEQEAVCCDLLEQHIQHCVMVSRTPRNQKCHNWRDAFVQQTMALLSYKAPQLCNVHQSNHTIRSFVLKSCNVQSDVTSILYLHWQAEIMSADSCQAHRPPSNGIDRQLPHSVGNLSICQDSETPPLLAQSK
jgi:hypothetical protein